MRNQRQKYLLCHITDSHQALDERIFYKAAKYASSAGYRVCICGLHPRDEVLAGVKIIPVLAYRNKIIKLILSITYLCRLALKTNADIYQIHDPGLLLLGWILSFLGKRVIYDAHEDYEQKIISRIRLPFNLGIIIARFWWILERLVSSPFEHIVTADSHIQQKFKRHDVTVIPNVPGEEFWINSHRTRLVDDEFRIVYLGSISKDRGIFETIEALKYVNHRHVTFHVIGGTDDDELIEIFRNNQRITWYGRMNWLDLGNELVNSDLGTVLLQPIPAYYYYPGENIVKLWEYMSVGLPILISNFPRLQNLCNQIEFGLSVDPTDPQKIAWAIDYMIDHPEERLRFGENGKRIVRSEYNAEKKMENLIRVYDHILEIESSLPERVQD